MTSRPIDPVAKFWSRVDRRTDPECWEWQGAKTRGYGLMRVNGRLVQTHRFSYQVANGPIADGKSIAHRCDNPSCVNPSHLFEATHLENMADMMAKGRNGCIGRTKTHCKRGHEFTPENTYLIPRGKQCLTCRRQTCRDWHKIRRSRKSA